MIDTMLGVLSSFLLSCYQSDRARRKRAEVYKVARWRGGSPGSALLRV